MSLHLACSMGYTSSRGPILCYKGPTMMFSAKSATAGMTACLHLMCDCTCMQQPSCVLCGQPCGWIDRTVPMPSHTRCKHGHLQQPLLSRVISHCLRLYNHTHTSCRSHKLLCNQRTCHRNERSKWSCTPLMFLYTASTMDLVAVAYA